MGVSHHLYEVENWGVGELWETNGRIAAHDPPTRRRPNVPTNHPKGTPGVPTETVSDRPLQNGDDFVPELLQRIHRFFVGERNDFADVPLDLDDCTSFQRDVMEALRLVPWGEVVAYGELAVLAGYPRAARAVGTFCAQNRYFLLVPCHRVVATGGIGSYGPLGIAYKRRLLRLEGHGAL